MGAEFETTGMNQLAFLDRVESDVVTYSEPTMGLLDLNDLGEITVDQPVTVHSVSGYYGDERRVAITVELYPQSSSVYVSDLWLEASMRGQGWGEEVLDLLIDNWEGNIYLYASTPAMKRIVEKLNFTKMTDDGWCKV